MHNLCVSYLLGWDDTKDNNDLNDDLGEYDGAVSTVEELNKVIGKCRKLVGSFKHSTMQTNKLQEAQKRHEGAAQTKLVQQVDTRWNSKYDSLNSVVINQESLQFMAGNNPKYAFAKFLPTPAQLRVIEELLQLLKPLKGLTVDLSGSNYTTASFIFPAIYSTKLKLEAQNFRNRLINNLRTRLVEILDTRFDFVTSNIFKAMTFLDFRFKKFNFIPLAFEREQCINDAKAYIRSHLETWPCVHDENENTASNQPKKPTTSKRVSAASHLSTPVSTKRHKQELDSIISGLIESEKELLAPASEDSVESEMKEFEAHQTLQYLSAQTTPLEFFSLHKKDYPLLSHVAFHLFSVPATSVPSECLFSRSGLICTRLRNRLGPKTLENLVFLKDNM